MTQDPRTCRSMAELRTEIDRIDRELVALLARRVACIDRAVVLKTEAGWPARIGPRVEEVATNARIAAEHWGLDGDLVEALWRQIIDWSIAREEATLGPDTAPSES